MLGMIDTKNRDYVELDLLSDEDQVSDDFNLYFDKEENQYYAIREPSFSSFDYSTDKRDFNFCLTAKSKGLVIAKAVDAICEYIVNNPVTRDKTSASLVHYG